MGDDEFVWSDDEEDDRVDNMVSLIEGGFKFKGKIFGGGRKPAELVGLPINKRGGERENS